MLDKAAYYQGNREIILNLEIEYYENNKERLREQAKNKCRELSDQEKEIKRKYGGNRYHNMSEENKQRLKEYQSNHCEAKKSTWDWNIKKSYGNKGVFSISNVSTMPLYMKLSQMNIFVKSFW